MATFGCTRSNRVPPTSNDASDDQQIVQQYDPIKHTEHQANCEVIGVQHLLSKELTVRRKPGVADNVPLKCNIRAEPTRDFIYDDDRLTSWGADKLLEYDLKRLSVAGQVANRQKAHPIVLSEIERKQLELDAARLLGQRLRLKDREGVLKREITDMEIHNSKVARENETLHEKIAVLRQSETTLQNKLLAERRERSSQLAATADACNRLKRLIEPLEVKNAELKAELRYLKEVDELNTEKKKKSE